MVTLAKRRGRIYLGKAILMILGGTFFLLPGQVLIAGEKDDLAEMQKRLNKEVMEKPFSVEDSRKIEAYIKDAMRKNLKPNGTVPGSWRPGYSCERLHDFYEYRDCLYYYRYYGHYYP